MLNIKNALVILIGQYEICDIFFGCWNMMLPHWLPHCHIQVSHHKGQKGMLLEYHKLSNFSGFNCECSRGRKWIWLMKINQQMFHLNHVLFRVTEPLSLLVLRRAFVDKFVSYWTGWLHIEFTLGINKVLWLQFSNWFILVSWIV